MIVITNSSTPNPTRVRVGYPSEPWTFAQPGDTVLVRSDGIPIASIETVAAPAGAPPVIDDESPSTPSIAIEEVGRHHFRVTLTNGETADVSIIACEPECFDRLLDQQRSGGAPVNKTRALAELARFSLDFHGRASELDNRPLQNFGA